MSMEERGWGGGRGEARQGESTEEATLKNVYKFCDSSCIVCSRSFTFSPLLSLDNLVQINFSKPDITLQGAIPSKANNGERVNK